MEDEIKVEIPEVPKKAATKKLRKSCQKQFRKAKQRRRKKSLLQKTVATSNVTQIIQDIR
ncbi:MAG: hypothetical protein IPL04_05485 [Chitinophagaceae bacterium]|nr:hypothetical protein [Chitinophagaceae bacterium]